MVRDAHSALLTIRGESFVALTFVASLAIYRENLAAVRDHNRCLSLSVLDLDEALADNVRGSMRSSWGNS